MNEIAAKRQQLCAQETALLAQRQRAVMSGAGITRSRTIQLRNEYKKALEEDKTAGEIILNGLTRCATEECLQLTDLMYRKLPTELRNLVYRFLCIEDQAIPVGPYYHFRPYDPTRKGSSNNRLAIGLSSGRILDDHSERPDPAILMPDSHIFNMAYMGQKVAFETQKAYLANNTFSVCNVENGIYHFLNSIEYGVSVTSNTFSRERPRAFIVPYGYVRKLQIRVKYEHCKPFLPDYLPAASGGYRGMFADECYFLRHSKNALGVLQHLPQRAQPLELEFIIMTETDQLTEVDGRESKGDLSFINLLQALRNTFYALMYDRENTKIRIIHHDEHISPFPRDITLLWSLTKEQWEYEKAANKAKSTWDADFYLAPEMLEDSRAHGGFVAVEKEALLRERWGIGDVFKDKRPKWPIQEGRYWPIGNGPPGWC